ncbi:hypothetical protein PAXINDRAFT_22450 [Paxillus involutus ATCC 200175]|uniref:Uncharacterized protein n=1 Tax=Paxillus involutus ATCC 200175 TaxID=664439 RepID=A0A0C9SYY4_PAXIN|nr:hypothetical protein PAXINDRAFT_22450 [Paxillus involutus ATCC 200175]
MLFLTFVLQASRVEGKAQPHSFPFRPSYFIDTLYGDALSISVSCGATYLSRRSATSLTAAQISDPGLIPRCPFLPGYAKYYEAIIEELKNHGCGTFRSTLMPTTGLSEAPPFPTEEPASRSTRPSRSSSRKDKWPCRSSKKEHVSRTGKSRIRFVLTSSLDTGTCHLHS